MMDFTYYKQYKHKQTGLVGVTYHPSGKNIEIIVDGNKTDIRVMNTGYNDREEVIEKDWIDECIFDIHKRCESSKYRKTPRHIIRREIEKHAPKQVKVTEEQVSNWYNSFAGPALSHNIINFLKQHNLLPSDENE